MSTPNPTPIREYIEMLRDSLLDCDIAVDDARTDLEAAIRQRNAVAVALKDAVDAYELREQAAT